MGYIYLNKTIEDLEEYINNQGILESMDEEDDLYEYYKDLNKTLGIDKYDLLDIIDTLNDLNYILNIFLEVKEPEQIEISRVSESTYLKYHVNDIYGVLDSFETKVDWRMIRDYYEDDNLSEYVMDNDLIPIRISGHEVGTYYDSYVGVNMKYSESPISILI